MAISKQKTALITGASTGIGYALAHLLAREGYDLGLMARREPLLEELKKDLNISYPDRKIAIAAVDVNDTQAIRKAIQALAHSLGSVDLFIANAGIGSPTPAWKQNVGDILTILQTNVMGAIASLEAAKEIMLEQRSGHLVGISSVAAFRGLPASSGYCASKAALTTYLESLRVDLKPLGLTVTSIHPGFIATPMTAKNKNMPFLLPVDKASQIIYKAIQKKKARLIFPLPMRALTILLRLMPDCLYDALLRLTSRSGVFK